ncbi:MAG TPA: hypothetical protein VFV19_14030 [Candidatus Polarisedimenticolaceae bacterium]|nr:hypothetical protein [Candidatus Polarisedimenticolaceae bacterium]
MKARRSTFGRSVYLVLAVAAATAAVGSAMAGAPPAAAKPAKRVKSRHTKDALNKSVPPPGETNESDDIQNGVAWGWKLLTYPKTTIPSQAFTKARAWIGANVKDGAPWPYATKGLPASPGTSEASAPVDSGDWSFLGPRPIDESTKPPGGYTSGLVSGRFNAIALDKRTTGSPGAIVAYGAAASGGVWKSTNCCGSASTWSPLWDGGVAATQAAGAIELDPNNQSIIYAGTGDYDGAGGSSGDQFGEGIMRSGDGGATWAELAPAVFTPFAAGSPVYGDSNITVLRVDPNNSPTLLAGTSHDLYISHDSAVSWSICSFGASPLNPMTGTGGAANQVTDILVDSSTNPTTVYVAVGFRFSNLNGDNGVYKGTIPASGCPTLTLMANGWPANTGNGTSGATNVGRIRLAGSRGNGTSSLTIYAQVAGVAPGNALGTWVTTNAGTSWALLGGSADANYKDCAAAATNETQDWYDLFLLADPGNDKTLYVGRTSLYKATVDATYANMTIQNLANVYSTACPGYGGLHSDQHGAAWISGTGGSTQFLIGNDGGIYASNGTPTGFQNLNQTLNVTQFYAGQSGPNFAGGGTQFIFAGAQDNGHASWDSSEPAAVWQSRTTTGDGFFTAFDPIAGTITAGNWYAEAPNGNFVRSTAGASGAFTLGTLPWITGHDRPSWASPFRVDTLHCSTTNCNNLVFGAAHLYSSADGAATWTAAGNVDVTKGSGSIIALDVARSEPTSVVVGTSDGEVDVAVGVFAGANCTAAAANTASFACAANTTPSWYYATNFNSVLPNRAILGVTFDPTTNGRIYAAVGGFNENTPTTPGHLFMAAYNGSTFVWSDKTGNLPDIPATSVVVNPANVNEVFVGMYMGFYYTDNINATPPVWYRYQYGMPDTRVNYLAVDRGSQATPLASTTLTAYTFGRGAYGIRLPGTTGSFPPHEVPATMTAKRNTTTPANVDVTWDPSSCPNPDLDLFWGSFTGSASGFATITGAACHLGTSGVAANVALPAPPPGSGIWFVLAGTDDIHAAISSFGKVSSGLPESFTGWSGLCTETTQNTSGSCP